MSDRVLDPLSLTFIDIGGPSMGNQPRAASSLASYDPLAWFGTLAGTTAGLGIVYWWLLSFQFAAPWLALTALVIGGLHWIMGMWLWRSRESVSVLHALRVVLSMGSVGAFVIAALIFVELRGAGRTPWLPPLACGIGQLIAATAMWQIGRATNTLSVPPTTPLDNKSAI